MLKLLRSTIVGTLLLLPSLWASAQEESERVRAVAVAIQQFRIADNDLSNPTGESRRFEALPIEESGEGIVEIEGSAPVDLELTAHCNFPIAYNYTWEIARDPEFLSLEAQFTQALTDTVSTPFRYPFEQAGSYFVRLIAANRDNSDESITQSFRILVSDSKLQVPNAFSPGNDGINDLFKVAFESIVRFNGNIFNRWGVHLFQWNDPAEGWDGRHNGKLVHPGVYFYVIEAEGSDGKKYKLKGDINLFRER